MGLFKKKRKIEETTPSPKSLDKVVLRKEHRPYYTKQLARKHTPCRWYCAATAGSFYMHHAIMDAFDSLGCASLLRMNHSSYPALTAEFLCTLNHDIESAEDEGTITFQLGNEMRQLSRAQWNAVFGFPPPPLQEYYTDRVSLKTMWRRISGVDNYSSSRPAAHTRIASPIFRMILRVLGNTVFARKENSKPNARELYVLFKALHRSNEALDMGQELLDHLMAYKTLTGEVQVGGMIAHLAHHFQIDLTLYTAHLPAFLTSEYLISAKIVHQLATTVVAEFGNFHTPFTPGKGHFHTWESWYETWSGEPLPQDWINRAHEEADPPTALLGRPDYAPVEKEEEPIVEEPADEIQIYHPPLYQDQAFHNYQQGSSSSSYAPPSSMEELYAGFHALRMDVHTIGNAFQDHRRSCAVRWEAEAQRRVVEDQRWHSLDNFMTAFQSRYPQAGPSSSSQYQTCDPTAGWDDEQNDPSPPQ